MDNKMLDGYRSRLKELEDQMLAVTKKMDVYRAIIKLEEDWPDANSDLITTKTRNLLAGPVFIDGNAQGSPCPCYWTEPCDPRCSCIDGASSNGCLRCCSYGNEDQRRFMAQYLARIQKVYRGSLGEG